VNDRFSFAGRLIVILAILILSARAQTPAAPGPQAIEHWPAEIKLPVKYTYLVFFPKGYQPRGKRWPLMLFLHGAGDAGANLDRVKILGPPMIVETNQSFPFILVSPQSPVRSWDINALNAFLDEMIRKYRVDKDRVYLTGASMGGSGTWAFAIADPEKFAAIAPVSGSGDTNAAARVAHLPVWAFHGAKDPVVKVERAQDMIAAVQAAGGTARLTIYPEGKHDAWTETYNNPELYQWLLAQKRAH
jgi:predicted peptidase